MSALNPLATISAIPSSINGVFTEGVVLTAGSVTGDPEGVQSINSYQWYRDGQLIAGATGNSHPVQIGAAGTYAVTATYTDGQGYVATVRSTNTVVSPISLGAIQSSLPNTFREGVTLSAGSINRPGTINSYQWLLNGVPINGATSASLDVNATAAGTYALKVSFSYDGGPTTILSSPEQVVTKSDNGPATLSAIQSSTPGLYQEGVTLTAGDITGDPDGNGSPSSYQWLKNGTPIVGATSRDYVTGATDAGIYMLRIKYTDGQGFGREISSPTSTVATANNGLASFSAITSSTGLFREGVTLSAGTLTGDIDGPIQSASVKYQWFRNDNAIAGATSATYRVPALGAGTYFLQAIYNDNQNFSNTVLSPKQIVTPANNG